MRGASVEVDGALSLHQALLPRAMTNAALSPAAAQLVTTGASTDAHTRHHAHPCAAPRLQALGAVRQPQRCALRCKARQCG